MTLPRFDPAQAEDRTRFFLGRVRSEEWHDDDVDAWRRLTEHLGNRAPGTLVVPAPGGDPNMRRLVTDGTLTSPGRGVTVRVVKGERNRCHSNVARRWATRKRNDMSIATGYCLDDDGLWRCHSWLVTTDRKTVVETTVPRVAYFGIVLDDGEATDFVDGLY